MDFVGKPLALLKTHALDAQYGVDEIATVCPERSRAYFRQNASTAFIRRRFSVVT